MSLKLPDVRLIQLVARTVEVMRELLNRMDVALFRGLCVVATLEFLEHELS